MNVLIVNTFDRGGAANSCKRLHMGLLQAGIDSKILLKSKENNWKNSFQIYIPSKNKSFLFQKKICLFFEKLGIQSLSYKEHGQWQHFLNKRPVDLELFSFPQSNLDIIRSTLYQDANIINLHWVADFINFQSFFAKNKKPVVWTLHDMNPFSGGEHYEETFLGIDQAGFPKRRNISAEEVKISAVNKDIKRKALARVNNLTIVAPSKWLVEEATKSGIFEGKEILHIPYGLDPEKFYPKNKRKSREFFKIPKEKKVILFVSDSLNKNRKGFMFLKKAFESFEGEDFLLCAVGSVGNNWERRKRIMELGTIKEEEVMCTAYSAADVFVIPSLMDNLPNTVLESLMCGTPVIGFPVGGIPEMIQTGENGIISKEVSVDSLVESLEEFFTDTDKFSRDHIRANALLKYDKKIQAEKYINLFQELLNR